MNDSTSIKYQQVRSAAQEIMNNKNEVQAILDDFTATINDVTTKNVFAGTASDALKNRFEELRKKFDEYVSTVDYFSKVISSAASATESTEMSIKRQTENL